MATLTKPKVGSLYPPAGVEVQLSTVNTDRTNAGLPTLTARQMHAIVAARPGGSLSDFDWADFATNYKGVVPR